MHIQIEDTVLFKYPQDMNYKKTLVMKPKFEYFVQILKGQDISKGHADTSDHSSLYFVMTSKQVYFDILLNFKYFFEK